MPINTNKKQNLIREATISLH